MFGDGEYIVSAIEVAMKLPYQTRIIFEQEINDIMNDSNIINKANKSHIFLHHVEMPNRYDFSGRYIPNWKLYLKSILSSKITVTQYEVSDFDKNSLILSVLLTVLGIVGFIIAFLVLTLIY